MNRILRLSVLLVSLSVVGGCLSVGYKHYRPGEINEYDEMLSEFVEPIHKERWAWVRGRTSGDIDGDGKEEEVVVATVHKSPRIRGKIPEILQMVLLITSRRGGDRPHLLRRSIVYDSTKPGTLTFPDGVPAYATPVAFSDCSVRVETLDEKNPACIIVSLWGKLDQDRVLAQHAVYRFQEKGPLARAFYTWAIQYEPGLDTIDIDKDGRDEFLLEQTAIAATGDGEEQLDHACWPSVYRCEGQAIVQADAAFPSVYEHTLLPLYEHYVRALQTGADVPTLGLYEYYLGMAYRNGDRHAPAERFLKRAVVQAEPRVRELAEKALAQMAAATAKPATPEPSPAAP